MSRPSFVAIRRTLIWVGVLSISALWIYGLWMFAQVLGRITQ